VVLYGVGRTLAMRSVLVLARLQDLVFDDTQEVTPTIWVETEDQVLVANHDVTQQLLHLPFWGCAFWVIAD
jgi:hypothetical protein